MEFKEDKEVLVCMGFLGHPYALVIDGRSGGRTSHGECNTIDEAITMAEDVYEKNPRIYRRKGNKYVPVKVKLYPKEINQEK